MPDSLLQYRITEKVGAGGMGVVWRAFDTRLHREVALKVLPENRNDSSGRARLLQEARSASALNHPNIVTIYGVDSDNGVDFIAMELVRGHNLHESLRQGPLPPADAIRFSVEICDALAAAHSAGVIHRDLKPANIMITASDHVKVVDFGIAKLNPTCETTGDLVDTLTAPLTAEESILGTWAYMSPEQALGDPVDHRTDIFSFGIVLYQMLRGSLPFHGETRSQIIRSLLGDQPAPLLPLFHSNGPSIDSVVRKCLAKNPEDRYQHADELLVVLRALHLEIGAEAAPKRFLARNQRTLQLLGAGTAALLALSAGLMYQNRATVLRRFFQTDAQPATAREWYAKGRASLDRWDRAGAIDSAIDAMKHAVAVDARNAASYAGLAEAYTQKDVANADPQWRRMAIDAGRKGVLLDGDLAQAHLSFGIALMRDGQQGEAARQFVRALQLDPQNALAHLGQANQLAAQKDYAAAQEHYRQAMAAAPTNWFVPFSLGRFYYGQAHYEDAVAQWQAALKLTPDNVAILSNLAAGFHMLGRDADSAAELQRALEIQPEAYIYNNLGTRRYYLGDYDDAVSAFEKAVAMNANRYMYWGNLGDAYRWSTTSKEKAAPAYERAIQILNEHAATLQSDSGLLAALAGYQAKRGDSADALNAISLAIANKPSASTWFTAVVVFEICGRREQALAALKSALRAGYAINEIRNEPELVALRTDVRYHSLASTAPASKPFTGTAAGMVKIMPKAPLPNGKMP